MLDALKNLTSSKGKHAQKQSDDLESLIATAREERSALSTMLTTLNSRTAKLAPLGKALDDVTGRAAAISSTLDEIVARLAALDERTRRLDEVDRRIHALEETARQAEQTTQKAIGPDGELHKYREGVQHLSSQALQTQAALDTLKKERAALDEIRAQMRDVDGEAKQSLAQSGALKAELD
jgi:chromosome segregation ATPase